MKNRVIIGMMLLLLINGVMTGFLIAKVVAGDKRTEEIYDSVDDSLEDMSEEISEVKDSVEGISETVREIDIQINPQVIPGVSSQIESDKAIEVEIWIDEENNIHRTGVGNDIDSLAWEIIYNGELVLSRNALNETVYQYFRSDPGTYTIYVTSFFDGSYKIVSNVISYSIE